MSYEQRNRIFREATKSLQNAYVAAERHIEEVEEENDKLRELAENLLMGFVYLETKQEQQKCIDRALDLRRELDVLPMEKFDTHELGIEVDE